jgi:hypothetical protein
MKFNQSVALQNAGDFKGAAHIVFDLQEPEGRNFEQRAAPTTGWGRKKRYDQV